MRRARVRVPDRQAIARLALAAQQDDARALDALLTAIRPSFAVFFRHRTARDVAEDLTQAALIQTAGVLGQVRAERVVQHMSTIARALLQDECLRQEREDRQSAPAELAERVECPVDLERQTELDELRSAISSVSSRVLPPELQAIVVGVLDDRTLAEIAAHTGLEPGIVRLQLTRVRAILRRELRHYGR